MKRKLLAVFLILCLCLPALPVRAAQKTAVPRPDSAAFVSGLWGLDVVAVVNEHGELWIHYIVDDVYEKGTAFRAMEGVKGVTANSRALYILKKDGTLWMWYITERAEGAPSKVPLIDVIAVNSNASLAVDKDGGVHRLNVESQYDFTAKKQVYWVKTQQIDTGAIGVSDGYYQKADGLYGHVGGIHRALEFTVPNVKKAWVAHGANFLLTESGDLWSWGENMKGQLGNGGRYDRVGSFLYVGSYKAEITAIPIRTDKPERILRDVSDLWVTSSGLIAVMEDGTCMEWGGAEPIRAYVDATGGVLRIGEWTYPEGWPNGDGWSPKKVTVSQWNGKSGIFDLYYQADGTLQVDTSHMGTLVYGGVWNSNTPKPVFPDVPIGSYCDQPVRWAVEEGVTTGTDSGTFAPEQTCTQGQILTFLWRAVGQPDSAASNPYTAPAVTEGQYFYAPMLWAWEEGLIGDADLDPNSPCRRADVVTYLWKLAGQPRGGKSAFADVDAGAEYASAVAWAVKAGITKGTGPSTFGPEVTCTRAQIVTFLYRYFVEQQ